MNIFEGARRIAYLAGGLAAGGTFVYAILYEPYISIDYSISRPQAAFQRLNGPCAPELERASFTTTSRSGASAHIDVCLLAKESGKNEVAEKAWLLITQEELDYLKTQGMTNEQAAAEGLVVWEVASWRKQLEDSFVLPEEDDTWVEEERSRRYWDNFTESFQYLALALATLFGCTWAIGWIVRGFMGIPRGMDRKPRGEP